MLPAFLAIEGLLCYSGKKLLVDPFVWISGAKKLARPLIILVAIEVTIEILTAMFVSSSGMSTANVARLDQDQAGLYGLLALAKLAVLIAAGILYFMWLFRSVKAVIALSKRPFPFSAGMTVAYHFIPILSLFMPYQAIAKTFDWSTPRTESLSFKTKITILMWWVAWIVANVLSVLASKTPDPSAEILASVLSAVAGVLLIPLVLELPKLQEKRLEEWRLEQTPPAGEFVEYPRYPEAQA